MITTYSTFYLPESVVGARIERASIALQAIANPSQLPDPDKDQAAGVRRQTAGRWRVCTWEHLKSLPLQNRVLSRTQSLRSDARVVGIHNCGFRAFARELQ